MTAAHTHRPADKRSHKRKPKAAAPAEYAPGYFCELVYAHNWPPRFESIGAWASKRAPAHVIAEQCRSNAGFNVHALGLTGAIPHVKQWEARKDMEAKA